MIFYNFWYYVWGHIVAEREQAQMVTIFYIFYKFALLSTILLPYPALPLFRRPWTHVKYTMKHFLRHWDHIIKFIIIGCYVRYIYFFSKRWEYYTKY